MEIKQARFVMSNDEIDKCPGGNKPEFAFIGRSNVGKSSLINMLVNNTSLAKTSSKPGKTKLINHFIINEEWYLVDLPGYGYAEVPKTEKQKLEKLIREFILNRNNLYCLFVLVDSRHEPQLIDLEFIHWLGINEVPFALVFTKADKLNERDLKENIGKYREKLLKTWEQLPECFIASTKRGQGRQEILNYMAKIIRD